MQGSWMPSVCPACLLAARQGSVLVERQALEPEQVPAAGLVGQRVVVPLEEQAPALGLQDEPVDEDVAVDAEELTVRLADRVPVELLVHLDLLAKQQQAWQEVWVLRQRRPVARLLKLPGKLLLTWPAPLVVLPELRLERLVAWLAGSRSESSQLVHSTLKTSTF